MDHIVSGPLPEAGKWVRLAAGWRRRSGGVKGKGDARLGERRGSCERPRGYLELRGLVKEPSIGESEGAAEMGAGGRGTPEGRDASRAPRGGGTRS